MPRRRRLQHAQQSLHQRGRAVHCSSRNAIILLTVLFWVLALWLNYESFFGQQDVYGDYWASMDSQYWTTSDMKVKSVKLATLVKDLPLTSDTQELKHSAKSNNKNKTNSHESGIRGHENLLSQEENASSAQKVSGQRQQTINSSREEQVEHKDSGESLESRAVEVVSQNTSVAKAKNPLVALENSTPGSHLVQNVTDEVQTSQEMHNIDPDTPVKDAAAKDVASTVSPSLLDEQPFNIVDLIEGYNVTSDQRTAKAIFPGDPEVQLNMELSVIDESLVKQNTDAVKTPRSNASFPFDDDSQQDGVLNSTVVLENKTKRESSLRGQPNIPSHANQQLGKKQGGDSFVEYFANNGYDKPFDIMQNPMGIHRQNVTYIAYQGPHEDPYVISYNHADQTWFGPFKAGVSTLGKELDPPTADSHGKPAMAIDAKGHIHLSFGGHGGDCAFKASRGKNKFGRCFKGEQIHVRSVRPLDITEWKTMHSGLSVYGSYPQFVQARNTIFHMVRHGQHGSSWTYQRSIDNGLTFEQPKPIVLTGRRTDELPLVYKDSWYCHFAAGRPPRDYVLMAACVYHKHVAPPHHTIEAHNMYYLEMDTRTKQWYNASGHQLEMPLTKKVADKTARAFKTYKKPSFHNYVHPGAIAMDDRGYPHMTFSVAVTGEMEGPEIGRGDKKIVYFRWTGYEWEGPTFITGKKVDPNLMQQCADGDLLVENWSNVRLLCGSSDTRTAWLSWYNSRDGGRSWEKGDDLYVITRASRILTSRMIINGNENARILAFANQKSQYRRMYLLGDNGPVERAKIDADICKSVTIEGNGIKGTLCLSEEKRRGVSTSLVNP